MLQHRGVRYNAGGFYPTAHRPTVSWCSVADLTVRPTVATADACPLKYKRFYPVCFTTEEDSLDFGPLYDPAAETTFDVDTALLVNAGVAAGADICLTYDTPFLKESLCAETCVTENPGTTSTDAPLGLGSYKTTNNQCATCKKMCLVHLSDNLRDNEGAILPERLELLCSSCRI